MNLPDSRLKHGVPLGIISILCIGGPADGKRIMVDAAEWNALGNMAKWKVSMKWDETLELHEYEKVLMPWNQTVHSSLVYPGQDGISLLLQHYQRFST